MTYLRARYYHPALGRFLTPDALVPDGLNGQAWNGYAYVYNDVANLVDPSGFDPEPGNWCSVVTLPGCTPNAPSDSGFIQAMARDATPSLTKNVGQTINNAASWWTATPSGGCGASASDENGGFWLGRLGTLGIAKETISFVNQGTVRVQQRIVPFGIGLLSKGWQTIATSTTELAEAKRVQAAITQAGLPSRWLGLRRVDTRVVMQRGIRPASGQFGLVGGIVAGGALDAFLQWANDNGRCLSGQDRVSNALIAGAGGVGSGLMGSLVTGAMMRFVPNNFGWKAAAVVTGTLVGYLADNNGKDGVKSPFGNFTLLPASPIAGWRDASLR